MGPMDRFVAATRPVLAGLRRMSPHRSAWKAGGVGPVKLTALLLLASCGGAANAEPTCPGRPAFTESTCWDPGGGVTRCQAQDGSYWDKQPDGHVVHWRQDSAPPAYTVICEEDS